VKEKITAQRYVSQDGLDIYYWVTLVGKEFRVLHPGSSMNHTSLERLEQGLNDLGYSTVTFDPRGSGYSSYPVPREYFTLDRVTNDLAGIIAKEGIERPIIISHSFGFMPAVEYALGGNVGGIVGICGSYHIPSTTPHRALFELFDKGIIYTEYAGSLGMKLYHALTGTSRPECSDQSEYRSEFGTWLSIVDIPLHAVGCHTVGQREINTWDIRQQLSRLRTPMLLIYAENDVMVRPFAGEHIKGLARAPCRTITVPGATHSLPMQKPETVLKIIQRC
jgi:pimeloyl-ACP methyl ester carboxylesterase